MLVLQQRGLTEAEHRKRKSGWVWQHQSRTVEDIQKTQLKGQGAASCRTFSHKTMAEMVEKEHTPFKLQCSCTKTAWIKFS